jgi:hypothetical protein
VRIDPANPTIAKLLSRFGVLDEDVGDALAAYETARERFEAFAHLDAPSVPADDSDTPQVLLARWQVANFGGATLWQMALGVAEELGELAGAGTPADVRDAIGDTMIYACQHATLCRLAFSSIVDDGSFRWADKEIGQGAGLLAHVTLKAEQRIRGMDDPEAARFGAYLALLAVVDEVRNCDAESWECFTETAAKVMRRDWRADAVTGGEA